MAVATDPGVTLAVGSKVTLTFSDTATASSTVQLGNVTYTFKADPAAAYDVDIGTDVTTQAAKLVAAINATGLTTAYYVTGTSAHPLVSAVNSGGAITLTGRIAGEILEHMALGGDEASMAYADSATVFGDITAGTDGSGNIVTAIGALQKCANAHLTTELGKLLAGE